MLYCSHFKIFRGVRFWCLGWVTACSMSERKHEIFLKRSDFRNIIVPWSSSYRTSWWWYCVYARLRLRPSIQIDVFRNVLGRTKFSEAHATGKYILYFSIQRTLLLRKESHSSVSFVKQEAILSRVVFKSRHVSELKNATGTTESTCISYCEESQQSNPCCYQAYFGQCSQDLIINRICRRKWGFMASRMNIAYNFGMWKECRRVPLVPT